MLNSKLGLISRLFRVANWIGILLSLFVAMRVLIFVSDLPDAVEGEPLIPFVMALPVLSVVGLCIRRLEWLGVVGMLITLPWVSANFAVGYGAEREHVAFTAANKGDAATLRQALAGGANPNGRHPDGFYLLAIGAASDNPEVTRVLLNAGARVNARKGKMSAPLLHAVLLLRCPSAVMLLKAGANPEDRLLDYGNLALGDAYKNISARDLHYLNRKEYARLMKDQACWSEFEALLQNPPRDSRWALVNMWESLRRLY
jgi:hypothetical protein